MARQMRGKEHFLTFIEPLCKNCLNICTKKHLTGDISIVLGQQEENFMPEEMGFDC